MLLHSGKAVVAGTNRDEQGHGAGATVCVAQRKRGMMDGDERSNHEFTTEDKIMTKLDPHTSTSTPAVSARGLAALRKTRPWIRFMAIIFAISAIAMTLIALAIVSLARGATIGIVSALVYGVLGVAYLLPSLYLFRCYKAIDELLRRRGDEGLECILEAQASFWQTMGAISATAVVLGLLGFVALVVSGPFPATGLPPHAPSFEPELGTFGSGD